jgi:AcrR family transcriptional regulator
VARTTGSDGERTQVAIRDAAIELFARHGYEAVTMREIAARVGVQAAAIYRYFPNKEDLLFRLLDEHMRKLLDSWAACVPADGEPRERLAAFVRNHIRFHIEMRNSTHISNLELRSLSSDRLEEIVRLRGLYEQELRQILVDGQDIGRFVRSDITISTMAIIQMMTGVIVWFRPDERLSVDELADTYHDMTMRLVGANAEEAHV